LSGVSLFLKEFLPKVIKNYKLITDSHEDLEANYQSQLINNNFVKNDVLGSY